MAITSQEAWAKRESGRHLEIPKFIRETIEEIAFQARDDKRVDRRSGVSQRLPISCLENVVSNAEQRAARNNEKTAAARITDVYSAIPSMTGKLELEYEGELRGADTIARELIRAAVGKVFTRYMGESNLQPVVQWFEIGGELKILEMSSSEEALRQLEKIQGLMEHIGRLGANGKSSPALATAAAEFILEGLWAHRRISRNEERGFHAERPRPPAPREPQSRPRRQFN
jgi:magnesium chelatase subunit I